MLAVQYFGPYLTYLLIVLLFLIPSIVHSLGRLSELILLVLVKLVIAIEVQFKVKLSVTDSLRLRYQI